MALASLLQREAWAGNPLAPRASHHVARAKAVIYLFMAGGPSQLELFDPKPQLTKLNGQPIPDAFTQGKRFAFMSTFTKDKPKLLAARRKFAVVRYDDSVRSYLEAGPWARLRQLIGEKLDAAGIRLELVASSAAEQKSAEPLAKEESDEN